MPQHDLAAVRRGDPRDPSAAVRGLNLASSLVHPADVGYAIPHLQLGVGKRAGEPRRQKGDRAAARPKLDRECPAGLPHPTTACGREGDGHRAEHGEVADRDEHPAAREVEGGNAPDDDEKARCSGGGNQRLSGACHGAGHGTHEAHEDDGSERSAQRTSGAERKERHRPHREYHDGRMRRADAEQQLQKRRSVGEHEDVGLERSEEPENDEREGERAVGRPQSAYPQSPCSGAETDRKVERRPPEGRARYDLSADAERRHSRERDGARQRIFCHGCAS